jgi:hypothetical protein
MAFLLDESQKCKSCGSSSWEWEEDKFAYGAGTYECRGCMILDAARDDYNPGPGISMVLIPKKKVQELQGR